MTMSCHPTPQVQSVQSAKLALKLLCILFSFAAFSPAAFAQETEDDPKAVNLFNRASNLFNDKDYETAIGQFNQVLEKYPGFSGRRDAQFFSGMAHYHLKQYDKALSRFESLRDSLPNFDGYRRSSDLLFFLGYCQYKVGLEKGNDGVEELQSATKTFQQFFENFDSASAAADAWFYNGEAFWKLNEIDASQFPIEKAANSYKQVVDRFKESPVHAKATLFYGQCVKQSGQYASALKVFDSFLENYPQHELTDEVRLNRASSLQQIGIAQKNAGNADEAKNYLEQAEQIYGQLTGPDSSLKSLRPEAMHQRALGLLLLDQHKSAAELYATIATDFPEFSLADNSALDAGKYFFSANELDQAEKWLNNVIEKDNPLRPEATHWLCQVMIKKSQPEKALQLANVQLENPGQFAANLLFDSAEAMEQMPNRKREAINTYLKIANEFPDHKVAPKALYFAAFGYLDVSQNQKAIDTAQSFISKYKTNSDVPWAKDVIGRAALREKQLELAKATFTDLTDNYPNHPRAEWWKTRLGWIEYMAGQRDTAIAMMSQGLSSMKDPNSRAEAWHIIGSSQFDLKNYEKAIDALEKSVEENDRQSNIAQILVLTARSYAARNNVNKAVELILPIWQQAKDPIAAYWLAEFEYQNENFEKAAEYYQAVIDDGKSAAIPDAMFGMAWTQSKLGKDGESRKMFDQLIEQYPNSSVAKDALVGRGKSLRVAGDFEDAIKDLNEFIANTNDPQAKFRSTFERALCYRDMKNWPAAIEDFETLTQTIDQDPDREAEIIFELAWAYRMNDDSENSLAMFKRLVNEFGNTQQAAEANYLVGQSFYASEDYDNAIKHYETALKNTKDSVVGERAAYKLGYSYFSKEDYRSALKAFQTQTENYPKGELHGYGLSMVAESHYWLKQHADAITVYKKSIPGMPSDENSKLNRILALLHAAESANKTKEYQTALEFAETVVKEFEDSEFKGDALNEMATAYKGLDQRDKAMETWATCAEESLGKAGAKAFCMIGEEHFADKEFDKAIEQFKLAIYGYGGTESPEPVRQWQAFAAYECARCYYVQVSGTEDAAKRQALTDNAKKWFNYLITNYPNDRLAPEAKKQLATISR